MQKAALVSVNVIRRTDVLLVSALSLGIQWKQIYEKDNSLFLWQLV